jgi:hypothetical protein
MRKKTPANKGFSAMLAVEHILKCRRQNMIPAFVILFNFSIAAEVKKFYFRHFDNAWTLAVIVTTLFQ